MLNLKLFLEGFKMRLSKSCDDRDDINFPSDKEAEAN